MVNFEVFDEISCIKGSGDVTQKVNDILSFIRDKGAKGELKRNSFVLEDNLLNFTLAIAIPMQSVQSS